MSQQLGQASVPYEGGKAWNQGSWARQPGELSLCQEALPHVLCPGNSKWCWEAGRVTSDSWTRKENKSSKVGLLVPYSLILHYASQPLWRRVFGWSPNISGAWNRSTNGDPPTTWLNISKFLIRLTSPLKKVVFSSYLNRYTLIMTKLKIVFFMWLKTGFYMAES